MRITKAIESVFQKILPSPFTIAVFLTFLTVLLAFLFTGNAGETALEKTQFILVSWQEGIWNNGLLVFAYQMMLILVLGHVLVLSKPMSRLINRLTAYCTSTEKSAFLVAFFTMLVAFFNWGLGLIFGALFARKVAEHAQRNNIAINYPIIGAAGYLGLMVWHGGISGSAPIKINESGHLQDLMAGASPELLASLPEHITFGDTIFSWWNLLVFSLVVLSVSIAFYLIAKQLPPTDYHLTEYQIDETEKKPEGAERLDRSTWLNYLLVICILAAFFFSYADQLSHLQITPNLINFFLLGLCLLLHGNFQRFMRAVGIAITDISGILIQFPLYFGIMGIMNDTGLVTLISDGFLAIANAETLPIFTFFSAGLVNIFVPSGGGQWVVQGPILIESAFQLDVPLNQMIMALAYGDQVTNMLQPFWALPLLGITRLDAKDILPYTLIAMCISSVIYLTALLLL